MCCAQTNRVWTIVLRSCHWVVPSMVVTAWWCAMTGIVPWFLCLSMRRRPCQAQFGTCAVVSWTFLLLAWLTRNKGFYKEPIILVRVVPIVVMNEVKGSLLLKFDGALCQISTHNASGTIRPTENKPMRKNILYVQYVDFVLNGWRTNRFGKGGHVEDSIVWLVQANGKTPRPPSSATTLCSRAVLCARSPVLGSNVHSAIFVWYCLSKTIIIAAE